MGQFIDKRNLRMTRQRGIEVELRQRHPAIFQLAAGNLRQSLRERIRLLATVRLDVADDDVASRLQLALCRLQHRVGLAHAGAHAEEYLEATALLRSFLALDGIQQRVGIGAFKFRHKAI